MPGQGRGAAGGQSRCSVGTRPWVQSSASQKVLGWGQARPRNQTWRLPVIWGEDCAEAPACGADGSPGPAPRRLQALGPSVQGGKPVASSCCPVSSELRTLCVCFPSAWTPTQPALARLTLQVPAKMSLSWRSPPSPPEGTLVLCCLFSSSQPFPRQQLRNCASVQCPSISLTSWWLRAGPGHGAFLTIESSRPRPN